MPEVVVAIPGDLATATGGYIYARRLIAALPDAGWQPRVLPLPASFPFPDARALEDTARAFASLACNTLVLVDGLAFGTLPADLLTAHPLRFIALVHHPLAAETGLSPATAEALFESERAALAQAIGVIATSAHTAQRLATEYAVPAAKIAVARPGTDATPPRSTRSSQAPVLLTVATLTPRKGHLALVAALASLRDLPWRAVFVGSETRDPATATAVRGAIQYHGLAARITLRGEVDTMTLTAIYRSADIFVLPSRYEGYGMAFAEALAHGLPVVGCAVGAVPETVPTDASILVAPDAPGELTATLARVIGDDKLRARMATAAHRAAALLPQWSDTARTVAHALDRLAASSH